LRNSIKSASKSVSSSSSSLKSVPQSLTSTTTSTSSSSSSSSSSLMKTNNNISSNGLDRISNNNLWPSSAREALFLIVHSFMLDEGFICIVEMKSTVPGFAPPVREMPKDKLIPDGWNSEMSSYSFMYKHVIKPGKQFSLTCVQASDEIVMITLSERSGDSFSTEINIHNYVHDSTLKINSNEKDINNVYNNLDELKTKLRSMIYQLCPKLKPSDPLSNSSSQQQSNENNSNYGPTYQPRTDPFPYNPYPHNPENPYPRRPDIPIIGGGDLHPFPGLIDPYPSAGLYPRGDGNLIGPSHPFFDPNGNQGLFPQPRFDPFLPPTGPHGPNFGPSGIGIPGRGRGRGRPAPGEPNPDHLKPPNDDNFFT